VRYNFFFRGIQAYFIFPVFSPIAEIFIIGHKGKTNFPEQKFFYFDKTTEQVTRFYNTIGNNTADI
jgi:hypothetical protein